MDRVSLHCRRPWLHHSVLSTLPAGAGVSAPVAAPAESQLHRDRRESKTSSPAFIFQGRKSKERRKEPTIHAAGRKRASWHASPPFAEPPLKLNKIKNRGDERALSFVLLSNQETYKLAQSRYTKFWFHYPNSYSYVWKVELLSTLDWPVNSRLTRTTKRREWEKKNRFKKKWSRRRRIF